MGCTFTAHVASNRQNDFIRSENQSIQSNSRFKMNSFQVTQKVRQPKGSAKPKGTADITPANHIFLCRTTAVMIRIEAGAQIDNNN